MDDFDTHEDSGFEDGASPIVHHPSLFVVLECDRPDAAGARCTLAGVDEVVIGRASERTAERRSSGGAVRLFLGVPGRSMSATHARILRVRGKWLLEDCQSTNGTFLHGQRVQRAELSDGAVFELGHTIFIFRCALPMPIGTEEDGRLTHTGAATAGLQTLLPSLAARFAMLATVARSSIPILLLGETGTGKEIVARAIHELSERRGAFVAVNCGALSPMLVEGQLFGHQRGAFSGAVRDERGFVRSAHKGTLLLDEIGDLALSAQPALLRVLQERSVTPVGSAQDIDVDVRVIAATHRPLDVWQREQRFRSDLLARLSGFRLELPALSERREDIGVLIAESLRRASARCRFSPQAGLALVTNPWPRNIRQLVQSIERGLVLSAGDVITRESLGLEPNGVTQAAELRTESEVVESSVDLALKRELLRALREHRGNVARVAAAMGKKRMQIHRWMKRFGVEPSAFRMLED